MTIAKGTKPRKAKRDDEPSPPQSDTTNADSSVVWEEDMGTGAAPKPVKFKIGRPRNRLCAPAMLKKGQTEAARSFDASLEYFLEFMSLCNAKEVIQNMPVRRIPTGVVDLPYKENSGFAGRIIPEREVIRNDYLLTALLAGDEKVAQRGRRFLSLAGEEELDQAVSIERHLLQAIRGVFDDFVTVRVLREKENKKKEEENYKKKFGNGKAPDRKTAEGADYQEETEESRRRRILANMTLHALHRCKHGDGKLLLQLHPELAVEVPINKKSWGMWINVCANVAWLWNWTLKDEANRIAEYSEFDPLRAKLNSRQLLPTDLYREPMFSGGSKRQEGSSHVKFFDSEGKMYRYLYRWERLPVLCNWCARPVMMRNQNNRTYLPSMACSDECKKRWENRITGTMVRDPAF